MPQVQTRYITHRFSGGWATDLGKLVTGLPTETADFLIPYALEAQNIFWQLDGGFRKIGGTGPIGDQLESGDVVYGVYDYWKTGTTGSHTQRKICHVSTKIKQDQGNNTWTDLKTGLEDNKHPSYATFDDLLIIASESTVDVPMSWDQSTFQNLAGTPPNFAFSCKHRAHHWASGVVSTPSSVYYSVPNDPEDWASAASGSIVCDPGDGDEVRGIASYKNELWVFKGPNKGSIHRITGSAEADFARSTFIEGIPAAGHSTIVTMKDDLIFMTPTGSIRSLKATAAFGDYHEAALSFPIEAWLKDNINPAATKRAWAVNDSRASRLYFAVPTGANTTNDTLLCYDYGFRSINQPDRWSKITAWNAHSLGVYMDASQRKVMGGGTDGYVRELNNNTKAIDTTTEIRARVDTPNMNYGSVSAQSKTLVSVGITLTPAGNDDLRFYWTRDSVYEQQAAMDQGFEGVLLGDANSPTPEDFTLGDSADATTGDYLFGLTFREIYYEPQDGGEARWMQYSIRNEDVDEDLYVHALSTGVRFGEINMENVE